MDKIILHDDIDNYPYEIIVKEISHKYRSCYCHTVVDMIDGRYYEVKETLEEIDKLIKEAENEAKQG